MPNINVKKIPNLNNIVYVLKTTVVLINVELYRKC